MTDPKDARSKANRSNAAITGDDGITRYKVVGTLGHGPTISKQERLRAARAKLENKAVRDAGVHNNTHQPGVDISNKQPTARATLTLRKDSRRVLERARSGQTGLSVEPDGNNATKEPVRGAAAGNEVGQ